MTSTTKKDKYILTAESVTEGHPDKLCDTIADSVLDACLKNDPNARVACEVLATSGKILVAGEISAKELPDIPHIVCKSVREAGYLYTYPLMELKRMRIRIHIRLFKAHKGHSRRMMAF